MRAMEFFDQHKGDKEYDKTKSYFDNLHEIGITDLSGQNLKLIDLFELNTEFSEYPEAQKLEDQIKDDRWYFDMRNKAINKLFPELKLPFSEKISYYKEEYAPFPWGWNYLSAMFYLKKEYDTKSQLDNKLTIDAGKYIYEQLSAKAIDRYVKELLSEMPNLMKGKFSTDYDTVLGLVNIKQYAKDMFTNLEESDLRKLSNIITLSLDIENIAKRKQFILGQFLTKVPDAAKKVNLSKYKDEMIEIFQHGEELGVSEKVKLAVIDWLYKAPAQDMEVMIAYTAVMCISALLLVYGSQIAMTVGLSVAVVNGVVGGGAAIFTGIMAGVGLAQFYKEHYATISGDFEICTKIAQNRELTLADIQKAKHLDLQTAFAMLLEKTNISLVHDGVLQDSTGLINKIDQSLLSDMLKKNFKLLVSNWHQVITNKNNKKIQEIVNNNSSNNLNVAKIQ